MITTLSIMYCLVSNPGNCHREYHEMANPMICMMQAQQIAAQRVTEDPRWRIKNWKCGPAEKET